MTRLSVAFTPGLNASPNLRYQVERFSKHIYGGCETAEITVIGTRAQQGLMENLMKLLNTRAMITDDTGHDRWWGYVHEVTISVNGFSFGVSLDSMWNRVSVAYTDDFGTRSNSVWVDDAASIAQWGLKEQKVTATGIDSDAALARANAGIALSKSPNGVLSYERSKGTDEIRAQIFCKGDWFKANWRYYSTGYGIHEHVTGSGAAQNFGEGTDLNRVAQAVFADGPLPYQYVEIPLQKFGATADDVIVEIRTPNETGTLLSTATIDEADIPLTGQKYVRATLSVALVQSVAWSLVVYKNGASAPSDYYTVGLDTTKSYSSSSVAKVRQGLIWQPNTIPAAGNMNFRLIAIEPTTTQIARAIMEEAGDIFAGVDVENVSTTLTSPAANGDGRLGDEMERLLDISTYAGGTMAAIVSPARRVLIKAALPQAAYMIDAAGVIRDNRGVPLPKVACPVGVYIKPSGIFPNLEQSTYLGAAASVVIERAEYTAKYDRFGDIVEEDYRFIPRGARDPFSNAFDKG